MEKTEIWDALKQPPPEALKSITGGRLKGKTDINPQWRYRAMTEQFGVCGVGWRYTIDRLWLEPTNDEVCAFAEISLSIMVADKWSDPIPGIGGSMLIAQESSKLYVSDDAYKMAVTDALSVAMKMIGVAADVYAGLFDGAKYSEQKQSQKKNPTVEDNRSHWCEEHEIAFFKTAKMRSYAHPRGEGEEWCHEHTSKPTPEPTESQSSPVKEETKGKGKAKRDPATIKNIEGLARALKEDFDMSYAEQYKELNITNWNALTISPAEAYKQVSGARE